MRAPDRALLDTSAIVALLHAGDADHAAVAATFRSFRGTLLTTEAVLTESLYLLAPIQGGREACLEFFIRGAAVLVPASRASLVQAKAILARYTDLPADYADATLVALAGEMRALTVFTLDRRDFGVYRREDGKTFRIVP